MTDLFTESNQIAQPKVESAQLSDALSERYLTYALSTIMHRALPDARDGLKPVHRRILFAMRELKLDAAGAFRKCAKIVGEVMGNFHPHGDKAIYDALARLAQDFNVRYPLVDGQGNFGNIDGDNPAAQRYTEARLTKVAEYLLEGLSEDAVDFRDNYDGSEKEPVVLPAGFPQLLANGSSGIAVGMATNIPPHNVSELCDALNHLVAYPNATVEKLLDIVKGPDFPTGGVIVDELSSIIENYKTGRGSFRLRAKFEVEETSRGMWQIIIKEIPFQVQKSKLVERIAELIIDKKILALADIRDESDEEIRLVLEPRARTVDPKVLMENLFKITDLEVKFSLNMNMLVDGVTPKVCGLKEALHLFLNHRKEVLLRRSRYRINKIDQRLEIVEGYLVTFLNLDDVIEIIRFNDNPKSELIRRYDLSETQAEGILNLRLKALRQLEELELKKERDELLIERSELEDVIDNEKSQWKLIKDEISNLKRTFNSSDRLFGRRTTFGSRPNFDLLELESAFEREPITIVYSKMGWIRAMKGHIDLNSDLKFRDGDGPNVLFHAFSTDKILILGSNGRCYTILASSLPGGRGMGEPIRIMIEIENNVEVIRLTLFHAEGKELIASNNGNGFLVCHKDLEAQTRNGKQIFNLGSDNLCFCVSVVGDHVACVSETSKLLIFPISELPELGRGKGVRLQKIKDGKLSDLKVFNLTDGLSWKMGKNKTRLETDLDKWVGRRASVGSNLPFGFPKSNKF